MAVVGGGIFRQDTFRFGMGAELVDGTSATVLNTNLGIIKGAITLPDPQYDWDFFFGINREGRGRRNAHLGNENFSGSIPQIFVLHDESRDILRQVMGELSQDIVTLSGTNPGVATAVAATSLTDSGEAFNSGGLNVKADLHAVFSGITIGYIGDETDESGTTVLGVFPTPNRGPTRGWNGPQPAVGDSYEIRRVDTVGVASGDKFAVLGHRLPTMTWGAQFRNTSDHGAGSVGSFLTVNYLGGKVNRV